MISELTEESGFSLIEGVVVSALLLVALGMVGAVLISALRTARFAEQESQSLDEGRLVVARIERDLRSATFIDLCTDAVTSDDCVTLRTETADAVLQWVRYRLSGTTLLRETDCTPLIVGAVQTYTCSASTPALTKISPDPADKSFTCDSTGGSVKVKVHLRIGPLADSGDGVLQLRTSARPRRIAAAGCS